MADIQPMSDERWTEIQRLAAFGTPPDALPSSSALARMIEDLVDEVERLRAALEREQNEHANCEDVNAQRFQTLTDTIIALTQQVTAMRPMVEAVATHTALADNRSNRYLCMFCLAAADHVSNLQHASNCMAEQARTYLAEHPAGEAS